MSETWDGLLLVDKPEGPTSHDIVARVRKATGQRRVGHAGTLDPMASGLLPLVLGRATRLVRFLPRSPKVYGGTFRLGLTSDTDDRTGEILHRHEGALPEAGAVAAAAKRLEGHGPQIPPTVSARKIEGTRAYRLAREGRPARARAAEVEVADFEVEPTATTGLFRFTVRVSAGTYVRALVRDLGAELGCGGLLDSLRRTEIGPLAPDDRLALDPNLAPDPAPLREALIGLDRLPLVPPSLLLADEDAARRFCHGAALFVAGGHAEGEPLAIRAPDGTLLGIAEKTGDLLKPRVVLAAPGPD